MKMKNSIPNEILEKIDSIRNDFDNGSTTIAKKALGVLEFAIIKYKITSYKMLYDISQLLIEAKPSMAAVRNLVRYCRSKLKGNVNSEVFLHVFVKEKLATAYSISDALEYISRKKKTFKPYKKLHILTCSYSSAFIQFLREAKKDKLQVSVNVLESNWNNRKYGELTAKECLAMKVNCQIFPDNEIDDAIKKSNLIITGADTILPKGRIVNGYPSLELAKSAFHKIPFFVIAESYKKSKGYHETDGFDYIPAQYIKKIFSDSLF
jgi:translation initiation factor 2B subunit (eIF-2B alpha/beta/delta family)